jgi:hypothetical protein
VRDEEYDPQQVPAYGESSQPAIAARMRPHLRMTQAGTVAAVLAVAVAVAALITYPRSYTGGAGYGWVIVLVVCAALLALICGYQLVCWTRAMKAWSGNRSANLGRPVVFSFVAHLGSYLVLVVALWAGIAGSASAGWTATSAVLQPVALVLMLAAQTLAGVQYLRESGPPGTIPAHMRRLVRRENERARRLTPRT